MPDFTPDGQMQSTLHIRIGSSFKKSYKWSTGTPPVAVDLTGWTARMQIRAKESDVEPLLTLSTETGEITLGADGAIDIDLEYQKTETLTGKKKAVFDIELTHTATNYRRNLIGGPVILYGERTRS